MKKEKERPADRIRQLAQFYIDHKAFKGMNVFEGVCHMSNRYVKNICVTTHGNPGVDVVAKIYTTFKGVSLHWLVLGEGSMFTVSDEDAIRYAKDATADYKKELKIRGLLNSRVLKDMTREERLELIQRVFDDEK